MAWLQNFAKKLLTPKIYISYINMAPSSTSALAKLRKVTGYSVSNCKKALQMHSEDIEKAEAWLHEEAKKQGWLKIASLQNRPTAQGLVGVYSKGSIGAMVEVNCETDFVAKNEEFQCLVTKILSSCLNHTMDQTINEECRKLCLDGDILNKLSCGSSNLGDLVASAIGKFGEKTIIRRAVCFKTGDSIQLSSYSHPAMKCSDLEGAFLGRYASLVAFRSLKDEGFSEEHGYQLCQHIVGMNPLSVGDVKEALKAKDKINENIAVEKMDTVKEDVIVTEHSENIDTEETIENNSAKLKDSNENRLVFQQYLIDPDLTVAQFITDNALEILDFHRFECGEEISNLQ